MTLLADQHLAFTFNVGYQDVVEAFFLRLALSESLTTFRGSTWVTRACVGDLPGETLAQVDHSARGADEVLVRVEEGLCHAILRERSLTVRIAARDADRAATVQRLVKAALPEAAGADPEVPVRFWWWQPQGGPRDLARMLPASSWGDVDHNYPHVTRVRVAEMAAWCEAPPTGGRLVLWHGEPGTGKTSAIRALANEWRSWADFQFITDPEEFLGNPSYLLNTLSESRRFASTASMRPWRIMVLEDAGEYLAPDAKYARGQALSRLLNVCDGVLGQAMKALVLVTTNEPLRTLHPALSRPGRCLAQITFERFDRVGIETWAESQGADCPARSTATLADLYADLNGASPEPRTHQFGFVVAE